MGELIPVIVNGREALFSEERVGKNNVSLGLSYPFRYDLRHADDDWSSPATIERLVVVNFFGTIFCKEAFDFKGSDYLDVESFEG